MFKLKPTLIEEFMRTLFPLTHNGAFMYNITEVYTGYIKTTCKYAFSHILLAKTPHLHLLMFVIFVGAQL